MADILHFDDLFEVEKVKTDGAYATVYIAKMKVKSFGLSENDRVAVKLFNKRHPNVEAIDREVAIMKKISHLAQFVKTYAHIHIEHQNYSYRAIVMEYVPGEILYSKFVPGYQALDRFAIEDIKVIFKKMLLAAKALHSKKIVHRDIKGENVIFDHNLKDLRLIDFGFSINLNDDYVCRNEGTFEYISPEIAKIHDTFAVKNAATDEMLKRADMWAIGILFYEIIFGRSPTYALYKKVLRTCPKYMLTTKYFEDLANFWIEDLPPYDPKLEPFTKVIRGLLSRKQLSVEGALGFLK